MFAVISRITALFLSFRIVCSGVCFLRSRVRVRVKVRVWCLEFCSSGSHQGIKLQSSFPGAGLVLGLGYVPCVFAVHRRLQKVRVRVSIGSGLVLRLGLKLVFRG